MQQVFQFSNKHPEGICKAEGTFKGINLFFVLLT